MTQYRPDAQLSRGNGPVVQGSEVTIRAMSGRSILAMETEKTHPISELIEYCRRMCASIEGIPEVCVSLIWKPPVRMQLPAGFNPVAQFISSSPIRMEATMISKKIPDDDDWHERMNDCTDGCMDRCLVCYDPAIDVDDFPAMERSSNCVRCHPCSLCDNCKVLITRCDEKGGNIFSFTVCLQCIEPEEIPLLTEAQASRRSLVFHEDD